MIDINTHFFIVCGLVAGMLLFATAFFYLLVIASNYL